MVSLVFAVQVVIIAICYARSMHYHKMSKDLSLSFMNRKVYEETSKIYLNICAGTTFFAVVFMLVAATNGRF